MRSILNVNELDVKIEDKIILHSFTCSFDKFICILGESGTGKSLLLKHLKDLFGKYPFVEFYFGEKRVVEDWMEELDFFHLSEDFQEFCSLFFQNEKFIEIKCMILSKLLTEPMIFFCEELPFGQEDFSLLCDFLRKKNILFTHVTSNIERVVLFDYLYVLKNNRIAIEGETTLVLQEEKLMKLLGFSLPFYVNLSIQLGYYGLVNRIYQNKEDLEVALWQSK